MLLLSIKVGVLIVKRCQTFKGIRTLKTFTFENCFTKNCVTYDSKCPFFLVIKCPKQIGNDLYNRIKPLAPPKPMGRWKPEDEDSKTLSKVDYANEDHCGPCGNKIIKNLHKFKDY
jgi:hypothetical protein